MAESRFMTPALAANSNAEELSPSARVVVHQLNNEICAILGFLELVREAMPEHDPARADLDEVRAAALRAAARAHELSAIGRPASTKLVALPSR